MTQKHEWTVTFTQRGRPGELIGSYASRNESMLAAQAHFDRHSAPKTPADDDELGWQMSFNGATAITDRGAYRVRRVSG